MPTTTEERLTAIETKLDRIIRLVELLEQLLAAAGSGGRGKLLQVLAARSKS